MFSLVSSQTFLTYFFFAQLLSAEKLYLSDILDQGTWFQPYFDDVMSQFISTHECKNAVRTPTSYLHNKPK